MDKYRKPDQYYLDNSHREVIAELKAVFRPVAEAYQELKASGEDKDEKHFKLNWEFRERAVELNRLKKKVMVECMRYDELRDDLVESHPIPKKPRCNTCGKKMKLVTHMFDLDCTEMRFLFECNGGHLPKRAIYSDGREYVLPQKRCRVCQGTDFISTREINGSLLIFSDECKKCGNKDILELDESPEAFEHISEQERSFFCTAFENEDTPMEGLTKFLTIIDNVIKHPKITYDTDVLKMLNVQQAEKRLKKKLKKRGFKKFRLGTPSNRENFSVEFSVLDASDRDTQASRSELRELISRILFKTNWRIMQQKITCRMGYLEGKIMGYEGEWDLQRIAGEIHERREKPKG